MVNGLSINPLSTKLFLINLAVVNELSFQVIISSLDIQKSLVILKYLIFAIFQNLYLLFGLILILLNRIIDNKTKYINVYLLINITFIYVVYLLVNDADRSHEFLLKFGIERLLFNISPIVILLFVETLDKKKNSPFIHQSSSDNQCKGSPYTSVHN